MYLRQQRRQLDESWRLLEQMEQQQQQQGGGGGGGSLTVDTAQSGTIPTSAGGGARGVGGARGGGVDLSALYEHCKSCKQILYISELTCTSLPVSLPPCLPLQC